MTKRPLITLILLSLVTCGIYGIYWMYVMNEELRSNGMEGKNFFVVLLLSLVTCGIYYLIYSWRMFQAIDDYTGKSNGILWFIINILTGLGFYFAQHDINNA